MTVSEACDRITEQRQQELDAMLAQGEPDVPGNLFPEIETPDYWAENSADLIRVLEKGGGDGGTLEAEVVGALEANA
ncbi:MAG: hypothetical protein ACXABY_24335, partial [Candidatus Thorarchaeota archaeon]